MGEQRPARCPKCGADLALKHPMWVDENLTRSRILCGCGHSVYYTERRLPPLPAPAPDKSLFSPEFAREMALDMLRAPWRELAKKLLVRLDKPVTKESIDHCADWLAIFGAMLQLGVVDLAKLAKHLESKEPEPKRPEAKKTELVKPKGASKK